MAVGEPPIYKAAELERLAKEFLARHFGPEIPIPVDIDLLLEQMEGVDLDYWAALRDNHRLEGMVLRDLDTAHLLIYIDEWLADHQPNRYRWTVAEELGHVVLHRQMIEQIRSPEDFQSLHNHYRWLQMDRNAKRFAAAILMPAAQVSIIARQIYPQLIHAVGFGNVPAVKKWLAFRLAQRFEVSEQTMDYRLREWPMRVYNRVEEAMRDALDYLD
jgi:Zn-dependent peptidase ImmA (M78 family)